MNFLKKTWTFLSELSGVIATIGYTIVGIDYLRRSLVDNKILLLLLVLLLPFVLFSIIKWIKSSFKTFLQMTTDIEIEDEVKQLEKLQSHNGIRKLIPNDKLIQRLGDSIIKKIKNWSEDGIMDTFTLYLEVTNQKNTLTIQVKCSSKWKKEVKYFYSGPDWETTPIEMDFYTNQNSRNITPFYLEFINWRKAIIKAYNSIESKIQNGYKLILYSHYGEKLHFEFNYISGIKRTDAFEVAAGILKNLRTGEIVEI